MNRLLFLSIACTAILACGSGNNVSFYHDEQQCGDMWNFYGSDDELALAAKGFLEERGVEVTRIEVTDEGQKQVCLACSCKTGRRIKVWTVEQDASILESLNFVRFENP